MGKSGRLVLHLLDGLFDEGRHVITDNWYTSYILEEVLYRYNTHITGAVKACRGVPPVLRAENVPVERSSMMRNGPHMVYKYEDRIQSICILHATAPIWYQELDIYQVDNSIIPRSLMWCLNIIG